MYFRIATVLSTCIVTTLSANADNADSDKKFNYMPQVHGTLRPRYELETGDMEQRFQVRNARVSLDGGICPVISYRLQADFCDRGKFKMLDAWIKLAMSDHVSATAGQSLIPFSVETVRSPHLDYFSNKSFIATETGGSRGVGAKVAWKLGTSPLTLEGGVFNNATMTDHDVWEKDLAYVANVRYTSGIASIEAAFKSSTPDSVRINMLDAAVTLTPMRWTVECEYVYKHYTHGAFDPSHAYSAFASYWLPVKAGVFNRLSFQGRWDGMTDHSSGKRDSDGHLYLTDDARNRLTLGATLSYVYPKVRADVRVNYENYFYHHGITAPQGERDKIIVELVVRF